MPEPTEYTREQERVALESLFHHFRMIPDLESFSHQARASLLFDLITAGQLVNDVPSYIMGKLLHPIDFRHQLTKAIYEEASNQGQPSDIINLVFAYMRVGCLISQLLGIAHLKTTTGTETPIDEQVANAQEDVNTP